MLDVCVPVDRIQTQTEGHLGSLPDFLTACGVFVPQFP